MTTKKDSKTVKNPPDFMAIVNAISEKEQCSRSEALSKVASQYPKLHAAYLDQANVVRKKQTADSSQKAHQYFMKIVAAISEKEQCSRSEALSRVAIRYPKFHAAYLDKMNRG